MIDKIDAGYCINNDSPMIQAKCDCYKFPVPYTFLGHNGVIFFCREWYEYLFLYSDECGRKNMMENSIAECLTKRYPQHDNDNVRLTSYWNYRPERNNQVNLEGIVLNVTASPFDVRVVVMPSYFLSKVLMPGFTTFGFDYWWCDKIPLPLKTKMERKMRPVMEYNLWQLNTYTTKKRNRRVMLTSSELLESLTKKINNYETVC